MKLVGLPGIHFEESRLLNLPDNSRLLPKEGGEGIRVFRQKRVPANLIPRFAFPLRTCQIVQEIAAHVGIVHLQPELIGAEYHRVRVSVRREDARNLRGGVAFGGKAQ